MLRKNKDPESDSLSSFLVGCILDNRAGLWMLEKSSNMIAFYYKVLMYDIHNIIARIYPPLTFDWREIKLEKKLVYGGPRLEELIERYGGETFEELAKRCGAEEIEYPEDFDSLLGKVKNASPDEYLFLRRIEYEAQSIHIENFRAFQKKVEGVFIYSALSRRWIPKLRPYHHPSFDPLQLKTAIGRRTMALQLASGLEISSVGVARGGLKYGIISDEQVKSYLRGVCRTAYELYGDKSKRYEETSEIVIK